MDPDPDPNLDPDLLVSGMDRGSGSTPKCHGSGTLVHAMHCIHINHLSALSWVEGR